MKKLIVAIAATLLAAGSYAQAPNKLMKGPMGDIKAKVGDCEAKAVSKDGKPLAGAAKNAFMKKCMGPAGRPMPPKPGMMPQPMPPKPGMMPKPMPPKPGMMPKPMPKPGMAPNMPDKPMPNVKRPMSPQQAKMRECAAKSKGMKGAEHKKFMSECLKGK